MSGATTGSRAESVDRERLLDLIERNADGMMVVDGAGTIVFANEAAGRLFDREADDLLGQAFGHALVGGETTEVDVPRRGEERVAELRAADFEWDGEPATLISLRDITLRKQAAEQQRELAVAQARQAEAEARAERADFLARLSGSLEGHLELEPSMRAVCHLCAERLSDWCSVDLLDDGEVRRISCSAEDGGLLLSEVPHVRRGDAVVERLQDGLADRLTDELPGDWRGGHVLRVPITSRGQKVGALTALRHRDRPFTSDDIDLAREIGRRAGISVLHARLFRDAREASRAKSDFLAVMSHELRTPLNAIIGYADLMGMGVDGEVTEKQERHIGKIRSSSQHLLQLVEEILTYIRMEGGQEEVHLAEVRLADFLHETADMVAPMADSAGLEFVTDLPQDGETIVTDPQKARQLIVNLLSNAVKYTDEGRVELRASLEEQHLCVQVIDTGIGMSEEELEHLFEPFWQAAPASTRRSGGTGLGMSVAQRLSHLLGGSLEVESEPEVGTRCVVRLPYRHPGGAPEAAAAGSDGPAAESDGPAAANDAPAAANDASAAAAEGMARQAEAGPEAGALEE